MSVEMLGCNGCGTPKKKTNFGKRHYNDRNIGVKAIIPESPDPDVMFKRDSDSNFLRYFRT